MPLYSNPIIKRKTLHWEWGREAEVMGVGWGEQLGGDGAAGEVRVCSTFPLSHLVNISCPRTDKVAVQEMRLGRRR